MAKKKGSILKIILGGVLALGCLSILGVVVIVGGLAAVIYFGVVDTGDIPGLDQLSEYTDFELPEIPEIGGENPFEIPDPDGGEDAAADAGDGAGEGDADEGDAGGEGDAGAAGEPTPAADGGAVDDEPPPVEPPADDGQADAADTYEPPTPAPAQDSGRQETTSGGRGSSDSGRTVAGDRGKVASGPVTVDHSPTSMSMVGDSLSLSATTSKSGCTVYVYYRAQGGSWKKRTMSRSGTSHSYSLEVSGDMSPAMEYYLEASGCGEGRWPAGGGVQTVKVF